MMINMTRKEPKNDYFIFIRNQSCIVDYIFCDQTRLQADHWPDQIVGQID